MCFIFLYFGHCFCVFYSLQLWMAGLQCTLAPHLLAVYHLTSAQIGLVFVAPAAAYTLIAPLAGRLADSYPMGTLQVRGVYV